MGTALNFQYAKASKLFPVLAYNKENHLFICEDKHLSFGFISPPLPGAETSAQTRINALLNQNWPPETCVQFAQFSSPDIDEYVAAYKAIRTGCKDPELKAGSNARADFLLRHTDKPIYQGGGAGIRVKDIYLIITVKVPIKSIQPTEDEVVVTSELQQSVGAALQSCGFVPTPMDNAIYRRVLKTMMNWGSTATWREELPGEVDEDVLIQDQILDWGRKLRVEKRGLTIDDKHIRILSAKQYPEAAYFGIGKAYLSDLLTGERGIQENVLLSLNLIFPDAEQARGKIDTMRTWVTQQASGPMVRFVPAMKVKKEGYDLMNDALSDGDRPVKAYFGMALFCDDESHAQRAVSNARTYFRDMGFQLLEDAFFCLPLFLNMLPMGGDPASRKLLMRHRTLATRHVVPLLPIWGEWQGTGTPTMNLIARAGQLMSVDLWDTDGSMNALVCAQSGSGKSVFGNFIVDSYLSLSPQAEAEDGAQIWIIDQGRSYLNTCKRYNGQFIEFSQESRICLNPYPKIENYDEEADILIGLLIAMAAPKESLSDLQTAQLKKIHGELWSQKGKAMLVDDVAEACMQDPDQRIVDIGKQLYPFTSKGEYGRFFVGENNVNMKNRLCVLELDDLKGREHLQQVVLLMLIYQIQQEMYLGQRDKKKVLMIDEAWDLLTKGAVASFIEGGYRRFRKYNGAAICITQAVDDLYASPSGLAIVQNSPFMFLLNQKGSSINKLQKEEKLDLTPGEYKFLKTVHTTVPHYSEIYVITEKGRGCGRLILDPFTQLVYSTKAEDVQAINRHESTGMERIDAIKQVLRDRGRL
jgi:conjugal transfer ATP-binding protein TraC